MASREITAYRIYFLNAKNRIVDAAVIDCGDDATCVRRALVLLRERTEHRAIEIWRGNHKVGVYALQTDLATRELGAKGE